MVNLFLKPNGKEFFVETRDGESKIVNITDVYHAKAIGTNYENRVDFYHGANNYLFIRGNSIIYDAWVLSQVLENRFINARNTHYDFDITKEFTWEFKDLVEIKKRKRIVNRIVKPTLASLAKTQNARAFVRAQKLNTTIDKSKPHPNYRIYEFFEDKYEENKSKAGQQTAQHELNLSHGGEPISSKFA